MVKLDDGYRILIACVQSDFSRFTEYRKHFDGAIMGFGDGVPKNGPSELSPKEKVLARQPLQPAGKPVGRH
jgi:hypothetical protein